MTDAVVAFDPGCRSCPRLSAFLDEVGREYPDYHARPVPAFGVRRPALLVVGLAPGMHGANATGRPFTGDHAGILLYRTLYQHGFSSAPTSTSGHDNLTLRQCRITNAVKCLPPQNKPNADEINRCNRFLRTELEQLGRRSAVLCLGQIAHRSVIKALGLKQAGYRFRHGRLFRLPGGRALFDCYHCSRYNTQTGRLTDAMFNKVFASVRKYVDQA